MLPMRKTTLPLKAALALESSLQVHGGRAGGGTGGGVVDKVILMLLVHFVIKKVKTLIKPLGTFLFDSFRSRPSLIKFLG